MFCLRLIPLLVNKSRFWLALVLVPIRLFRNGKTNVVLGKLVTPQTRKHGCACPVVSFHAAGGGGEITRRQARKRLLCLSCTACELTREPGCVAYLCVLLRRRTELESEELVSELVHSFLLPEVQRTHHRERGESGAGRGGAGRGVSPGAGRGRGVSPGVGWGRERGESGGAGQGE